MYGTFYATNIKTEQAAPGRELLVYLRFLLATGLGGAFLKAGLPVVFLAGGLGGGVWPPCRGGTARIRHLGPDPMRSSRWAFIKASRTR